jgi:putative addiction module killer protein
MRQHRRQVLREVTDVSGQHNLTLCIQGDFGPGYRVYFSRRGETVYLLLAGRDKSTQAADIKRAQKMLSELNGVIGKITYSHSRARPCDCRAITFKSGL